MTARLDAAMALVGVGQDIQLAVGRAVKIQLDLGMGGLLIVLCRQKIIAAKVDDLFGNVRLAALLSKVEGASMDTRLPVSAPQAASSLSSSGIAMISLDFSDTALLPSTSLCAVA